MYPFLSGYVLKKFFKVHLNNSGFGGLFFSANFILMPSVKKTNNPEIQVSQHSFWRAPVHNISTPANCEADIF